MEWEASEISTPTTYLVNYSEEVAVGSEEQLVAWKIYSVHSLKVQVVPEEVAEGAVEVDSLEGSQVECLVASHLWVVHQEGSLGRPVEEADAEQIPSQVLVCE